MSDKIMYVIFMGNKNTGELTMIKAKKPQIEQLQRMMKAEGIETSYRFCGWLLNTFLNSRDPFTVVYKADIEKKLKIRFSESQKEDVSCISDYLFVHFRNLLKYSGFIKVTGEKSNEWSPGRRIENILDTVRKNNQIDVNEDITELKKLVKQQQVKLDKILAWCESDPVTPEKLELRKILKGE